MSKFVDNILADVCLDERISAGIFKIDEEAHMQALRDHLVRKGIAKEDAIAYTNKVLEGRFPERQAYNADGVLVTFPTPKHKAEAIKRGTHFEENPAPENSTPEAKPEKRDDIPPPAHEIPDEAKPDAPAPQQPKPAAAQAGPATSVVQGDKQLAVEPPRGDDKPEADPIPQPPVVQQAPKTPERVAAEKEVIKQILATDDTALAPIVPANEILQHQLNEIYKKCQEWGFRDAETFIKKLL